MIGKRVFLYVQHLLGIGHLRRAASIARALATEGFEVTLVSGGLEIRQVDVSGLTFVQLAPARAPDSSFKGLVDAEGIPVTEVWKQARRAKLLDAWRSADPHALIVELYPFGRRQMRFELLPLLAEANSAIRRPLVVSSVRDLLGGGQRNPARQDEMLELFERYFDRLLVHSDPSLVSFDLTFRHASRLKGKLHYTGYVVDTAPMSADAVQGEADAGAEEVIVSAGGGAVGMRLLQTAIQARPLSHAAKRTWRILCGVNAAPTDLEALNALARQSGEGRVVVERARPDFTQLLARCAVSVSQGGYNTIMESLQVRARSVVVPFVGEAEIEQTLRARLLAGRGLIELVEEDALSPQALAAAVDRVASRPRSAGGEIKLDGAERTAALLAEWLSEAK